jgi:hypothetical protein
MNKEILDKIIKTLKEKAFEIKFECHIFAGKSHIRGIYIYNINDKKSIKSLFDKELLKFFKIEISKTWYLGERKDIILLKFKNEIEIAIPEIENYKISNYSSAL